MNLFLPLYLPCLGPYPPNLLSGLRQESPTQPLQVILIRSSLPNPPLHPPHPSPQHLFVLCWAALNVHWKDWCWSWNANPLATWCKELTHLKRPWCWERLKAWGEWEDRGWGGWMASLIRWTWVWANSRSWWWTGKPSMLQSMGLQRAGHSWVTELKWAASIFLLKCTSDLVTSLLKILQGLGIDLLDKVPFLSTDLHPCLFLDPDDLSSLSLNPNSDVTNTRWFFKWRIFFVPFRKAALSMQEPLCQVGKRALSGRMNYNKALLSQDGCCLSTGSIHSVGMDFSTNQNKIIYPYIASWPYTHW